MEINNFYLDINATGPERQRHVKGISDATGADAKHLGAPTFAYKQENDYLYSTGWRELLERVSKRFRNAVPDLQERIKSSNIVGI